MTEQIYNPIQPYLLAIPGGFSPGRIAHVTGTFSPNATSLIAQFQTGPYGDPNDEIGMCIYNRINEGILGLNAFTRATGWGQEQACPNSLYQRGLPFEMTILCDPMCFKIAVNGQHVTEFSHRFNPATLTHLNIKSTPVDLTLTCVWIEDPNIPSQMSTPQYGAPHYNPNVAFPSQQQPYHPPPVGGNMTNYYDQQQYAGPSHHGDKKSKGLMGMVSSAGAAVAGALGASHLLGKKSKGYPSHGGFHPQAAGYGAPGGYSLHGGYPGHSSGNSGLLNKAMAVGGGVLGAKAMSKGLGGLGGSKAMKYGIPLAGAGVGGYMLSKGLSRSFSFGSDCSDHGWGGGSDHGWGGGSGSGSDCGGNWSD